MGLLDTLFGGGDDGSGAAYSAIARNRALLDQISLPEYEQFLPELYRTENANYELVSEDPLLRSAQMQALSRLAGLSETGLSDVDAAGFNRARQEGTQIARGAREAALADARARGVSGSGLEFAMREAGNQSGAQRAQQAGLETAANSARQRALYQQAYGDAISGARDQDYRANANNTGIINQFNRENTNRRNQTAMSNTDARNDAFKYNQGLKDKRFDNEMRRATGYTNLNNQEADVSMAQAEARRKRQAGLMGLAGAGLGAYLAPAGSGAQGAGLGYAIGSNL